MKWWYLIECSGGDGRCKCLLDEVKQNPDLWAIVICGTTVEALLDWELVDLLAHVQTCREILEDVGPLDDLGMEDHR